MKRRPWDAWGAVALGTALGVLLQLGGYLLVRGNQRKFANLHRWTAP